MYKDDICFMSACDITDKIKRQELSSEEITEVIIERIKKINPTINAYCTPTFELARELASKADESVKKGEKLGLLHGIPTSIKDETETQGIRTTYGCKIFENNVPHKDEVAVKRLRDAGIVILGKTNTPAFGYKGTTDNLIFGVTKNPWNLERTCGGSSGGAAAATASGLCHLALGSDGGGSIRIPSSFCGVFGLKATFGRVPHTAMKRVGVLGTLIHKGPIVRHVKDAALMLDVIAGEHPSDRCSLPKPIVSYIEKVKERPKKIKIGYSLDLGFVKALNPDVENVVLNAVQKFEKCDWSIEKSRVRIKNPEMVLWKIWTSGFAYTFKPFLKKWKDKIDPELLMIIQQGLSYSVLDLKLAEIQRETIYDNISRHFKKFDILITPTLAIPAFELGKSYPNQVEGKSAGPVTWMPFTYPFNLTGHPAASIPCGWSNDGLPIGMQIIGKRFDEEKVLQVSQAFEEIAPWHDKKPTFN